MRVLAIENELPSLDREKLRELLADEAARVWTLIKQEVIRDIWFTRLDKRAVILLECADIEEARRHLGTLPLVRERCIDFHLQELRAYDGFDRCFATGTGSD